MRVRKVVIPVAGWGTRSLPASKNIPKEMLPIYDKPVIQHVVEEAVRAGIRDVVFVTSRSKAVIGDHFDYNLQLEEVLAKAGKTALLHKVRDTAEMIDVIEVRQKNSLASAMPFRVPVRSWGMSLLPLWWETTSSRGMARGSNSWFRRLKNTTCQ